ncbi:MAG TPA: FAD-binding oxidoreductase [Candidatus Limnocylindrales bacterium]|nr:FAD-binding oxidoreductase [Candidatus Limnocylindrales bacterium]
MTLLERPRELDGIAGTVLMPSDGGYDAARQTFNGMLDKRPAVIVQCRSTGDVIAAVRAARAAGLPVAVRGGGHSVAGHCVADDALVVDLRHMRRVDVDPERRIARAQGGSQWLDLDTATTAHGLATTGGTFVDTGIAGLTLTGGIGYLMGTSGFTCDTLVGAEVVTADGSVARAGDGGDPELLWALRGGGGNFGVVTEFEYRLQPLGELQHGRINVPIAHAHAGLEAAAAFAHELPDQLNMYVGSPSLDGPPDREPDPAIDPVVVAINLAFQGSATDAEAAIEPLRARLAMPGVTGGFRPISYAELQSRTGILPFGLRHWWKGHFVRELDAAAIDAVVEASLATPKGYSFLLIESITGRARQEPDGGAAFGQREARWNMSALGIWEDPADDAANIAWVRQFADALRPSSYSGAGYGNYAQADEPAERIRASFGPDKYARLVQVKQRYDPDNVFRFNHNIPPADGLAELPLGRR